MKYSIVIPAYNEEMRIPPMLESYTQYFCGQGRQDTELIIVVNGSTDRTEQIAGQYAQRYDNVRVLVEPERVGKGVAVIMGIKSITGDYGGFVDADGATAPEVFQKLIDRRNEADCIIASRYLPESTAEPPQPWSRRIASRLFNTFVNLMFGMHLSDTQCGAKLMRREALETVLPLLGRTQWAFDVDLLFQIKRNGFSIREIPTEWRDVSGSKLRVVPASISMFISICRLRLLYSPFKWLIPLYNRTIGRLFPFHKLGH